MVSKARSSAPSRRMAVSRASATSSSRRPSPSRDTTSPERGVGDGRRPGHAGQLPLVLHLAQPLDHTARGHGLGRRHLLRPSPLGAPAHVVGLEAEAGHGRRSPRRGEGPALRRHAAHRELHRVVEPGRAQLLGGLGAVAPVGDELRAGR